MSTMTTPPEPFDLDEHFQRLGFLPDRIAGDTRRHTETGPWSERVAEYRDGAIFIVHYAGASEWERHPGEEIVALVDGATTMTLLLDGEEVAHTIGRGQAIVVPADTWHRFDTPDGARILTVTPQPTDHLVGDPRAAD